MKLSDMFPSRFLSGNDLQGHAVTVEISHVEAVKMRVGQGAPEETKYVVFFEGKQKGAILSKTLARDIAKVCGADDTDLWRGRLIVIFAEPITVGGEPRKALRARAATNGQTQPEGPENGAGQGNGQTQGGQ